MTAQNVSINADDFGISWESSPVQKRVGPNGSQMMEWRADAQIPVVVDLDKARKGFSDEVVLSGINGTSWRVQAQDVARRLPAKTPVAELRAAVIARLQGMRRAGVRTVREIVRYPRLDNPAVLVEMTGNPAQDLAALIDAGYPQEAARTLLKL